MYGFKFQVIPELSVNLEIRDTTDKDMSNCPLTSLGERLSTLKHYLIKVTAMVTL